MRLFSLQSLGSGVTVLAGMPELSLKLFEKSLRLPEPFCGQAFVFQRLALLELCGTAGALAFCKIARPLVQCVSFFTERLEVRVVRCRQHGAKSRMALLDGIKALFETVQKPLHFGSTRGLPPDGSADAAMRAVLASIVAFC